LKILSKIAGAILLAVLVQVVYSLSNNNSFFISPDDTSVAQDSSATNESDPDLPYPIEKNEGNNAEDKLKDPNGIRLKPSASLKTDVEYDPETGEYRIVEKVGAFEVNTPYSMKKDEYADMMSEKSIDDYWRVRSQGQRRGDNSAYSPLGGLGSKLKKGIFGDSKIDIVPQGSAELTFGLKYTKNSNTALPKEQQRDISFEFDNKIQMNVTGKIGDKLSLAVKYDTEAQFEIDNTRKIEYVGDEDEIIKKIEIGDVTFPSGNSLIAGSQSLMGFKTELQFGKMYVTSVLSRKKGESSTINVEGGAQTEEFEVRVDDYEENRHYLLANYFREKYDEAFSRVPHITNGVKILDVEIWTTQTSRSSKDDRDIIAITELGERGGNLPKNGSIYKQLKNTAGIRNKNTVVSAVRSSFPDYNEGYQYNFVEQAVKLSESQYEINEDLGYISLQSPLDASKVLGVAFKYEYKGEEYQVGDFANSGDDSSSVLIVKLLKGSVTGPSVDNWDLMMKNVYNIGGFQISSEDFMLDVLYEDDKTGMPINYISEGGIAGKNLLSVMNLDTISQDKQPYADGLFDFLEGFTIDARRGRIYFPVLEPFGNHLREQINDESVSEKYVYDEIYDTTKVAAREFAEKNKFILRGSYRSSVSSEISLNATNIAEGSVTVTAAGRTLVEGEDYDVNYSLGRLTIINQGLLESGTPIQVNLESKSLFNTKVRSFMGNRLEYRFNENMSLGMTMLRLSERVSSFKVGFEDYPINNRMWGFDAHASTEVPFLTQVVDKGVPFVKTKERSNVSFEAEYARIIPLAPKGITNAVEVDYFENTQRKIHIKEPTSWTLASTPQGQRMFKEGDYDDLRNGYNRAHLAWFDINYTLYGNSSSVSEDAQSEYFSRPVIEKNLFKNRDNETYTVRPMSLMNLAYFPEERGPYNFDVAKSNVSAGIDPQTGKLLNPEKRWAGIMRELTTTDFEQANVEYIEFWLLDPFYYDTLGIHKGGDLYFNLGMLSEDVLKDGRKSFENGITNDESLYDETEWARVPVVNTVNSGFDNTIDRDAQDVGLDGLNDDEERRLFKQYLRDLKGYLSTDALYDIISEDPANDNFTSYLNGDFNKNEYIYQRYRYYNGTDGNSPSGGSGQGTAQIRPDVEDINQDNTLQTSESYFQYKVSIRKEDLVVGRNFIVDKVTEVDKSLPNDGDIEADWYQFKIPLESSDREAIGGIGDFRSIQFMRMFLTNFSDSVILRIAEMSLLRSEWRKYNNELFELGDYDIFNDSDFDVAVVNIEENSDKDPVNYVLPPGVSREQDPMNPQLRELNEQALVLKVADLEDGNSKAVYKSYNKDFRQFNRLKMFVHAEALKNEQGQLDDGDVYAFIRLGSDQTKNYYEYEIPLNLTPHGNYRGWEGEDQIKVWPKDNEFDIDLDIFTELKKERNRIIRDSVYPEMQYTHIFYGVDENAPRTDGKINRISVKGNPNLGNVRTVLIGVRNRKKSSTNPDDTGDPISCEVWFNEMRLSDFEDNGGWAARASSRIDLADFATITVAGKTSQAGFGALDQRVFERTQENLYQYDVSTNVALSKFFPEDLGVRLPFYYGLSETFINPKYDPTNPDILFDESVADITDPDQKSNFIKKTQDYTKRTGFNFTNVRIDRNAKIKHPLNISNFSVGYAYTDFKARNINLKFDKEFTQKTTAAYNFSLRPKPVEPFKWVKNKQLNLIKDFNFYYLPNQFAFTNEWYQSYRETQRWNLSNVYGDAVLPATYSNRFNISRKYDFGYDIAKSLKVKYSALNESRIDDLEGEIQYPDDEKWKEYWEYIDDEGTTSDYNQKINIDYKIPINKIKPLGFISANYSYTGTYSWQKGAEVLDRDSIAELRELNPNLPKDYKVYYELGNDIKNSNSHSLRNTVSMSKLYNKSDYLKDVKKRLRRKRKSSSTKTVKYSKEKLKLTAGKPKVIKHNLGVDKVKINVLDENGKLVKVKQEQISSKKIAITSDKDVSGGKVIVTGKKEVNQTGFSTAMDYTTNFLMMTRTINVDYTIRNGSYVPGFMNKPRYIGLNDPIHPDVDGPGLGYVFGSFENTDLYNTMVGNDWISKDSTFTGRMKNTHSENLRFKASLEPINSMRISLESDRTFSENYERSLVLNKWTEDQLFKQNRSMYDVMDSLPQVYTNGSFKTSFNAIKTSFKSDEAFQAMRDNCVIIARRQAEKRGMDPTIIDPKTGYVKGFSESSQDVLIPAFIAAYSGQSAEKVDLDYENMSTMYQSFSDLLRSLNWRMTYTGLSKLKSVKKVFRSININHAYNSDYSVGGFKTFTNSEEFSYLDEEFVSTSDGNMLYTPSVEISNVRISERFSPLVGVDMRFKNSLSTKFEVKSNRDIALSFINTEITETSGFEFVVGAGYVIKAFKISFNNGKAYENDLNLRMDFSIRDNLTQRRNILNNTIQKVTGRRIYSLKAYADYELNERFNVRAYFDFNVNDPVTNGYRNTSASAGLTFRFSLAQ